MQHDGRHQNSSIMRCVILVVGALVFFCAFNVSSASAAHILDLIYRGATAGTNLQENAAGGVVTEAATASHEAKEAHQDAETLEAVPEEKTCACHGPECMCCVDFNMTFIDLGTGCVRMKYISRVEGVRLNVSYGDSLLRSGVSRGQRPAATCVSMIGQLAAVCARFTSLHPHKDGLKGCLKLEPKLLGDVQTSLSIGCFTMGGDGMRMDDATAAAEDEEQEATTVIPAATADTNQTSVESNLNEDEILAAVNESAQKGLAFFQNWLGLDFSAPANSTAMEHGSKDATADAPAPAPAKQDADSGNA